MNQSAHGFCKRLHGSIRALHGEEKADEICGNGVSSAATPEQKGKWAAGAMERLEAAFDADEQAQAMAGCACGPKPQQLEAWRKLYRLCGSLEEYARRRNENAGSEARFEAKAGLLYVSYPRCVCSMIKNAPGPIPRAWCLCSCEYVRRACSYAFERPVEVNLIKSALAGEGGCRFEVRAF